MVDIAEQRLNMVESQIRPSDVTDRAIIQAMQDIPRERFVPQQVAGLAYMDEALPLSTSAGQPRRGLMAPRVFAKLLQLAGIAAKDKVLDVGTGMGYSAAVLGKLAAEVTALESDSALAKDATKLLAEVGASNVTVRQDELSAGCPKDGPFDVIVLEGAVDEVPKALLDQLTDGGRLVALLRQEGLGKAAFWQRRGRSFDQRIAFDAGAPQLPGFASAPAFVL